MFMANFAYIRVSKSTQDTDNQKLKILEYCQKQNVHIDEFFTVEISSKKSDFDRKITALLSQLKKGDTIYITELSRLARNMLEILNLLSKLQKEYQVNVVFVLQPELSTSGPHVELLQAIYGYFSQTERELISERTKMALAARKAEGVKLGRPKGSGNKNISLLNGYKSDIENLLAKGISIRSICTLINDKMGKPVHYNTYRYYIKNHLSKDEYNHQLF